MTTTVGRAATAALAIALTAVISGCATPRSHAGSTPTRLVAVASINAWGSVLSQLGGDHVQSSSVINSPSADPHDYEPTPADGRVLAKADLVLYNGIGYDAWAAKTVQANDQAGQVVLDVGDLVGVPAGGNPHRWYSPGDVTTVANAIATSLKKLDPADAAYFDARRITFEQTSLQLYHAAVASIRSRYAGVKVGASESVFSPLAQALGLDLITPPSFLQAISQGSDPTAADKRTIDRQISSGEIKVYVLNNQNSTPDVQAQVDAADRHGIAVTSVSETLTPAGSSFQDWQVRQLNELAAALHTATGR